MTKQVQDAYIVSALRTPVGKAPRGMFKHVRPDDMLVHVLQAVLKQCESLDPAAIDDVIVGCAMPEAEQGINVARVALLLAGIPNSVSGVTVNRFCASGSSFAACLIGSTNPEIAVRGERSSCLTFATKSLRMVSASRISVTSWNITSTLASAAD